MSTEDRTSQTILVDVMRELVRARITSIIVIRIRRP
jgi:hypothetical protein